MVKRMGHEADQAHSGRRALDRLSKHHYDLVVADIFMQDGTGMELLISMRAKQIDVPFACVSGGDGTCFTPYASTMASLGAIAVLRKPVEMEQMEAIIASVDGR